MTVTDLEFIFKRQMTMFNDIQFVLDDHGTKSTIIHDGPVSALVPMMNHFTFSGVYEFGPCLRFSPVFHN